MARKMRSTQADLTSLDLEDLKRLWQTIFSLPAPSRMPKEFLLKMLVQGLQEQAAGGMSKKIEKALGNLSAASDQSAVPSDASSVEPHLKLGTRLVRGWGGVPHEVTVIDRGFAYRGTAYRSLSEIAKVITGAHWSGPRFFGLKSKRIQPQTSAGSRP
jgi:hypothetical protein